MTQWYYADAQRQRQGPVDTDTLRARLSQGIIDRSSLVWREGLSQWVALSEIAAELDVDTPVPATPEPSGYAPVMAPTSHPQASAPTADSESNAVLDRSAATTNPNADSQPDRTLPPATGHAPAPADQAPLPGSVSQPDQAGPAATPAAFQAATLDATPASADPTPAAIATPLPSAWDTPAAASPASATAVHAAPVVYAGLWRRLAASVLDSLITSFAVYLIVIPLVFLLALGADMSNAGAALDEGGGVTIAIMVLSYGIGLAIPTLYFAWMQSSRYQASLGKLACGIKLVRADSDGARVGFWRNLLRYLAYMLISVLTLGIGMIVSAFMAWRGERRQALHDKVCDTLVVDRWAFTDQPERQTQGLDTVSIVVLAIYGVMLVVSIVVLAFVLVAIGMGQS
ncbi:RDD family protein [Xanthomonas sp. 3058]|uniref:RDD family protein n=1 Tax=Xanthomonas sp. 3058 TaxID=3035314 RepID=UPI00160F022B|nr:RDD family protein [Xanthomonas sp. 3058]MBB5865018.1 putative RDD family membrane protein YckC [Xanthomonas sp. 3058]